MAKSSEGRLERVLQKNNTGTYSISVPISIIRDLRWQQGQRLAVVRKGKQVMLEDAPRS